MNPNSEIMPSARLSAQINGFVAAIIKVIAALPTNISDSRSTIQRATREDILFVRVAKAKPLFPTSDLDCEIACHERQIHVVKGVKGG